MLLISPKIQTKSKAFTLTELMVVILIIGILVSLMAGAVVKYLQWQRDPNNPNSATSVAINNVKLAAMNVYTDIVQKSKQEYGTLSVSERSYFQTLANSLSSRNTNTVKVLTEQDPVQKAMLVFTNVKLLRTFNTQLNNLLLPTNAQYTVPNPNRYFPVFLLNYNSNDQANAVELSGGTTYNNFYSSMGLPAERSKLLVAENSILKSYESANQLLDSNATINKSASLLLALENHPKGIKTEDLGAGAIAKNALGLRYIQGPSGGAIYFDLHYVDNNDFQADKNYKVGSLRLDVKYDPDTK